MNKEKINEQITVPKHTWKVKSNATPTFGTNEEKYKNKIIII